MARKLPRAPSDWPAAFLGGVLSIALFASDPAAACGPAALEQTTVRHVSADGDIMLEDGRRLRLAGLHTSPSTAAAALRAGEVLATGVLVAEPDRWGRWPALVFRVKDGQTGTWVQAELLSAGAALARPEPWLGACWPLLTRAEAAGSAHAWVAREAGRFARIQGRVVRVGDGRSARFVTVIDAEGRRATGVVQKRQLRRFREAGVDVERLSGHIVRMRGIRGHRNPATIALTMAEQIEIVR